MKEDILIICPHCDGKTTCKKSCCSNERFTQSICKVCKGEGHITIKENAIVFNTFQLLCLGHDPAMQAHDIFSGISNIIPKDCSLKYAASKRENNEGGKWVKRTVLSLSLEGKFSVVHAIGKYLERVSKTELLHS